MTALYVILALLAVAAAFWAGRTLGAQQRERLEQQHEQQALERADTIRREAEADALALREQARSETQAAQAAALAQAQAQADRLLAQARETAEEHRAEVAQNLREQRQQLEDRRSQLTEQHLQVQALQGTVSAERLQLEQDRERLEAERQALKAEMAQEREHLSADRQEYRAERDAMNRELERQSRRAEQLDVRGERLDALEERLEKQGRDLAAQAEELQARAAAADARLQEVAALSREEARARILDALDAELEEEKAARIRTAGDLSSKEIARQARSLIAQAIQRSASETSAQLSVSVVPIPSDAMKGRLIGREGRNIRAFEALTGVDLIIDDTPEAVMLSSFNPVRREVARHVLQSLLEDGRIHPTRIEEMVGRAQEDMRTFIHTQGEEAAIEAGVVGLKPGLLQLLGRMYFRSSYGQNVLKHSIQVAHLTGIMAGELGLDAALARRCGLLHDIGKSIDREVEGTHVDIGVSLGTRFGEGTEVIDAIAHHHDPENGETLYSVLVAAADAISAARPGARREELEAYTRRLEALEEIAVSFPGVQQAYAIQAGREVRVIVQPDQVSDAGAVLLARDVAGRIEQDMEYPGQVQVTVVRESRATEVAR
ncbi:2,3 cyclic-nucleotide 2-phosphodiesterase [Deinococcus proteolyticus MRP]|uniref:Ribonuclease Y n=1 Tax=Deinococcus proteolyticus (strain ATCC 35074 / DSM 20540 / JCM 6276 / NBRC 101906 / NCIMB 13154 / VKM Ac-1939 / CCM 2703 / MRP) TaxID=693977 RepID=F0RKA5_DEIPM|nr:ribonuclease Y [Deinococcus proteolyticus]ADY25664.1 2,3 cyclic-nucleotide 2-phosphodiesterase [Deinococcus proteolyticus MRP]